MIVLLSHYRKRRPVTSVERLKDSKDENTSYLGTTNSTTTTTSANSTSPCAGCVRPSNMSERARRYAALPIQVFGEALVRY